MLEHRNEADLEPMLWTTMAHIVHHNPAYIHADVAVTEALCTLLVQRTPTVPVSARVLCILVTCRRRVRLLAAWQRRREWRAWLR